MTTAQWQLDTVHSSIGFSVRHMIISKVHGRFQKWSGTLRLDAEDFGKSSVEIHIDAASIDTNEAQRDGHLRSADFFDAATFPELVFKSTAVEKIGDDKLRVKGDLTIHGVTRPVVLDVESGGQMVDPYGNDRTGFSAKTTIERKEFGLVWNQTLDQGGLAVGDRVEINIDIEATKAKAAAA